MYSTYKAYENVISGDAKISRKIKIIQEYMNSTTTVKIFEPLINYNMIKVIQNWYKSSSNSSAMARILKQKKIQDEYDFISACCGWSKNVVKKWFDAALKSIDKVVKKLGTKGTIDKIVNTIMIDEDSVNYINEVITKVNKYYDLQYKNLDELMDLLQIECEEKENLKLEKQREAESNRASIVSAFDDIKEDIQQMDNIEKSLEKENGWRIGDGYIYFTSRFDIKKTLELTEEGLQQLMENGPYYVARFAIINEFRRYNNHIPTESEEPESSIEIDKMDIKMKDN